MLLYYISNPVPPNRPISSQIPTRFHVLLQRVVLNKIPTPSNKRKSFVSIHPRSHSTWEIHKAHSCNVQPEDIYYYSSAPDGGDKSISGTSAPGQWMCGRVNMWKERYLQIHTRHNLVTTTRWSILDMAPCSSFRLQPEKEYWNRSLYLLSLIFIAGCGCPFPLRDITLIYLPSSSSNPLLRQKFSEINIGPWNSWASVSHLTYRNIPFCRRDRDTYTSSGLTLSLGGCLWRTIKWNWFGLSGLEIARNAIFLQIVWSQRWIRGYEEGVENKRSRFLLHQLDTK